MVLKRGFTVHTCGVLLYYRGYPPEHVPGHTSLMERSETRVPSNSLNYSSVSQAHGEDEEEDETEDSMQEEFDRMKLDDSAMSTAVTGRGTKVKVLRIIWGKSLNWKKKKIRWVKKVTFGGKM